MEIPLISALARALGRLFNGKAKKKKIVFNEIESIIAFERDKKFALLEKKAFSVFAEIKHLSKEIRENLEIVSGKEVQTEGRDKRLGKILETNKGNFLRQINIILQRIEPPSEHSFKAVKDYASNSLNVIESGVIQTRKSIAYTGFAMKKEVKEIGLHLEEIVKSLKELQEKINEAGLGEFEKLNELIEEMHLLERKLIGAKKEKEKIAGEISGNEIIFEEKGKAFHSLINSIDGNEFRELNEKISLLDETRKEVISKAALLIENASKPLKKLEHLKANMEKISGECGKEILNKWLNATEKAINSADSKGAALKSAAIECIKEIEVGRISFKDEKEKEKWIESLKEIIETDFFTEFFWKINSIESERNLLSQKAEKNDFMKKMASKKSENESIENRLNELKAKKANAEKAIEELRKKISNAKGEIALNAEWLLEKEIEREE